MPQWQLHDLRRTARSLMSRAGVRPDIAERVLGHAISGVEGVYDRHPYRDEKADALRRSLRSSTPSSIRLSAMSCRWWRRNECSWRQRHCNLGKRTWQHRPSGWPKRWPTLPSMQQEITAALAWETIRTRARQEANRKLQELLHLYGEARSDPDPSRCRECHAGDYSTTLTQDSAASFEALPRASRTCPFKTLCPFWRCSSAAKRRRGRRKGSTIRSDADLIRKMKILVGQGMSIPKAALQFADQARIGGTLKSTAKRWSESTAWEKNSG